MDESDALVPGEKTTETCTYDAKGNLVAWEVINGWTGDHKDTYVYDEYGNPVTLNEHTYYKAEQTITVTWKLVYCPNGLTQPAEEAIRWLSPAPGSCDAVNP